MRLRRVCNRQYITNFCFYLHTTCKKGGVNLDKNKLIAVLAYKLEENGVEREAAIAEAKSFVATLSDQDAEKLTVLSGNDAAMSKIALSLKKKAQSSRAQTAPVRNVTKADEDADGEVLQEAVPRREQPVKEYAPVAKREPDRPADGNQAPHTARQPQQQRIAGRARPLPQNAKNVRPATGNADDADKKPRPEQGQTARKTQANEKKLISRPDPNADYKKFYIILGCSSPVWVFLLLVVVTLFLVVIGALAASIVGIIAALVAAVALGTTVCVVGIVYGITQLFKYAPIGLYEIGLGLKIGGYLMLAGIVAYNIAVRLLPYLIKKVLELFVYTAHKCVELYFYVKGACANL